MRICLVITLVVALGTMLPSPASGQLRAGVASVDVTPPIGGQMYGYGARGTNVSTGVHDALYAKALVLEEGDTKLAIVSLDLGAFAAKNTTRVKAAIPAEAGIDQVLLVASHTHSSPRNLDDFPTEEKPWVKEAEQKIAGAILEANERLVPARIGAGKGEVREGHNRRAVLASGEVLMLWGNRQKLPTSPLDYELVIVRIEGEAGVIATLVNFTCHPVVLGPDNLNISADYPGVMMKMVESELGGQVMFLQGAPGDINPFGDKTPVDEGGFEEVERMGRVIADEVVRVSAGIVPSEIESLSLRTEIIPLAHRKDIERKERPFNAEINSVLIGDEIAFATFPGEFFVEHGLAFKKQSPIKNTFFVGYTNDALAYFPTIHATTEGGYGAASATQVEVGAGERLVNRALINLLYLADKINP